MLRFQLVAPLLLPMLMTAGLKAGDAPDPRRATELQDPRRTAELQDLRAMLPPSPPFEQWLTQTGELPPLFSQLPTLPYPPDIFTGLRDGKPYHVTRQDWPERRSEMRRLLEEWLVGHAPPQQQDVRAIVEKKFAEADKEVWAVRLEFGPNHAAKLHCWLWIPPNLKRPAPVFLVDNFKYTSFAKDALAKGTFAVCVYNAGDPAYFQYMPAYVADRKDESAAFADLFGHYDWCEFYRRGWSASRAVDWLSTLDFVDAKRIYIGGHSRSAKQAMVGAAFDDRIAGVIASSPGSGGSLCYRYCDQYYYGESTELLTRAFPRWVSPKVRFFTGRENLLPCDTHFEYALIAPRPVLMSTALNDAVENCWAVERTYDLVHPVYEFLGARGNLALRYRPGPHAPDEGTLHAHSAFLEAAAAGKSPADLFPYQPIHVWDYDAWLAKDPPDMNPATLPDLKNAKASQDKDGARFSSQTWPTRRTEIRNKIGWMLGDGPAFTSIPPDLTAGETDEEARRLHRAASDHARLRLGGGINANLYRPHAALSNGGKLPLVIWLAPLHTATGYVPQYNEGQAPYARWTKEAGCMVLAFDPIGTGGRQEERRGFYDRHPHWSLMGKMVADARHAIDAALALPDVDASRVYVIGFGMGGMTALITAAMDDRIAGAVSIAGFTPLRSEGVDSSTGGLRRFTHEYGWLPRLGCFLGHEEKLPLDFGDIMAAAAPKKMLIVAPTLDWHANEAAVAAAVTDAKDVYELFGAKNNLTLLAPQRPCQFDDAMQAAVIDWLR